MTKLGCSGRLGGESVLDKALSVRTYELEDSRNIEETSYP